MSCCDSQEELLYLLELIVDNLVLNADKIHESGGNLLVVKMKFLSMPPFVITQNDFESVNAIKSVNEMPNGKLDILSGISCLFNKCPRDLVGEMQKTPLKMGIFCVGDTYPIAECILPLGGCLCDQIAMASNDPDHMPKPYILRGRFGLLDPGKNPSGDIYFKLKITCLGKHVTTYYQIKNNSFIFKNDHDKGQYTVERVVTPPIKDGENERRKLNDEILKPDVKSTEIKDSEMDDVGGDKSSGGDKDKGTKKKNTKKKKKK